MRISSAVFVAATVLPAAAPSLFALARIGDGELTLVSQATTGYDSNVSANRDGEGDFFGTLRFDLSYSQEDRYFSWGGGAGVWGTTFLDSTEEDRINWDVNLFLNPSDEIGGRRFRFDAGIDLSRTTEADADLGARTTTMVYTANAGVTYLPNRKYFAGVGAFWSYRDPQDSGFVEETRYGGDARVGWHYSEKLDLSLNARYTQIDSDDTEQITSNTYTIGGGATGQFTPKLTGSLYAGWQFREIDTGDATDSTPYLNASLGWAINDLSSALLSASREFGSVSSAYNTESSRISLSYSRTLNSRLSATLGGAYRTTDYQRSAFVELPGEDVPNEDLDRSNDYYDLFAGLNYQINRWADASLFYRYSDQDSTNDFFVFDRHRIELSATARW